jgi:hypothetical protein
MDIPLISSAFGKRREELQRTPIKSFLDRASVFPSAATCPFQHLVVEMGVPFFFSTSTLGCTGRCCRATRVRAKRGMGCIACRTDTRGLKAQYCSWRKTEMFRRLELSGQVQCLLVDLPLILAQNKHSAHASFVLAYLFTHRTS